MTTAWPPNKQTPGGPGNAYPDVDINSERERSGGPTFAAVTSRSYHPGGVNTLFGDGSVKFIKSTIDGMVWRGLGTVAGGEVISADSFSKTRYRERSQPSCPELALREEIHSPLHDGLGLDDRWPGRLLGLPPLAGSEDV